MNLQKNSVWFKPSVWVNESFSGQAAMNMIMPMNSVLLFMESSSISSVLSKHRKRTIVWYIQANSRIRVKSILMSYLLRAQNSQLTLIVKKPRTKLENVNNPENKRQQSRANVLLYYVSVMGRKLCFAVTDKLFFISFFLTAEKTLLW